MFGEGCFFAIFIAGFLTSFTDIVSRKIKNVHLLFCFFVTLAAYLFQGREVFSLQFFLNIVLAVVIGLFLYWRGLWRAGDAKLFIFFSFAMITTRYDGFLYFPCLSLFIHSFLIGMLILFPVECVPLIKDPRWRHKKQVVTYINYVGFVLVCFFAFSWMLSPLFSKTGISKYPLLAYAFLYFGYGAFRKELKWALSEWPLFSIVLLGLGWFFRSWLYPASLRPEALLASAKPLFFFSVLYFILDNILTDIRKATTRFPFAPFLFMGCLLSYTDFLAVLMTWLRF